MKSSTFCVMPWNSIATNASGNYRVCCNSTPGKNFVLGNDGKAVKISKVKPSEIWNSETYKHLRKQMLDGVQPEMCERCFKEEAAGIKSARQNWNDKWYDKDKDYAVESNLDIEYVDLRLGNLCNLKCRMCNPYSSNQWVDEWNTVVKTAKLVPDFPLTVEETDRLNNMTWPEDPRTWASIIEIADSIEEIYLTGGEPTLAIEQYKLFDILIEKGLSKKIKLKYNTNLTNIPKKMIEYWSHFRTVQLNASIDAYGELNRYIRYPTGWSSVEKNIDKFLSMPNVQVQIHCTVQMYNILNLKELFDWIKAKTELTPYLNILNHPVCLNIQTLPSELKKLAEERLVDYLDWPKVKETIAYMNSADTSNHIDEFNKYTKVIDELRNECLTDHVPELGERIWNGQMLSLKEELPTDGPNKFQIDL
jgi:organic radical activating enzyme